MGGEQMGKDENSTKGVKTQLSRIFQVNEEDAEH